MPPLRPAHVSDSPTTVVQEAPADSRAAFLPPLQGAFASQPVPPQGPPPDQRAPRRSAPYATRRRLGTLDRVLGDGYQPVPAPPPPDGPAPKRSKALKRGVDALRRCPEAEEAEQGLRALVEQNEHARRRKLVLDSLHAEAAAHHRARARAAEDVARRELSAAEAGERAALLGKFAAEAPGVVAQKSRRLFASLSAEETQGRMRIAGGYTQRMRDWAKEAAGGALRGVPQQEHLARIAVVGLEWCVTTHLLGWLAMAGDEESARDALRTLQADEWGAEQMRRRERSFVERLELSERDRSEGQGWRQLLKLGEAERRARRAAIDRDIPTHEAFARAERAKEESNRRLLLLATCGDSAAEAATRSAVNSIVREEERCRPAVCALQEQEHAQIRRTFLRGYAAVCEHLARWAPARGAVEARHRDAADRCAAEERQERGRLEEAAAEHRAWAEGREGARDALVDAERGERTGTAIDESSSRDMLLRREATARTVAALRAEARELQHREIPERVAIRATEAAVLGRLTARYISVPLIEDEERLAREHLAIVAGSCWNAVAHRVERGHAKLRAMRDLLLALQIHEAQGREQATSWQDVRHQQLQHHWRLLGELRRRRAEQERASERGSLAAAEQGTRRVLGQFEAAERGDALGAAIWQGEWAGRRLLLQDEFDGRMQRYHYALLYTEAWSRWVCTAYEVLHRWWYVVAAYDSAAEAARAAVAHHERSARDYLERQLSRRLELSRGSAELRAEAVELDLSSLQRTEEPAEREELRGQEEKRWYELEVLKQLSYEHIVKEVLRRQTDERSRELRGPIAELLEHEESSGRAREAASERVARVGLERSAPRRARRPSMKTARQVMRLNSELSITLENAEGAVSRRVCLYRKRNQYQFQFVVAWARYDADRQSLRLNGARGEQIIFVVSDPDPLPRLAKLRTMFKAGRVQMMGFDEGRPEKRALPLLVAVADISGVVCPSTLSVLQAQRMIDEQIVAGHGRQSSLPVSEFSEELVYPGVWALAQLCEARGGECRGLRALLALGALPPAGDRDRRRSSAAGEAGSPSSAASSDVEWLPKEGCSPLPWEGLLLAEALRDGGIPAPRPAPPSARSRGLQQQEASAREAVRTQQHRSHANISAEAWRNMRSLIADAAAWEEIARMPHEQRRRLCEGIAATL
eukprot:TRINITY_DN22684_c0_g1_i1.p1 TRINITY_DN22684_c0_g1~~TRINITY_DN22684_c0_g1_i1.p1  ORF type:complete len:1196 (+),score=377.63 TRINITY_DN22684_c0_g1_i1:92-3589(+)